MRGFVFILALGALWIAAAGASGAGQPTTQHVINVPIFDPGGLDCATGKTSDIVGVVSGVVHTLVGPDGSVHASSTLHGTSTNDDLPTDGVPDATSTFVSHANDVFFAAGNEVHAFVLHGQGTGTATGAEFRFDVVLHLVLDSDGSPKVDVTRIICR